MANPQENKARLLSWSEVAERIPLSRTTVWYLRRNGDFPRGTRLSARRIAWNEAEIDAWIKARPIALRGAA